MENHDIDSLSFNVVLMFLFIIICTKAEKIFERYLFKKVCKCSEMLIRIKTVKRQKPEILTFGFLKLGHLKYKNLILFLVKNRTNLLRNMYLMCF